MKNINKQLFVKNPVARNIAMGVLIVVFMGSLGFLYLQKYRQYQVEQAAEVYYSLLHVFEEDAGSAEQLAKKLVNDHPKTIYAMLAGLYLSKTYLQNNDLPSAKLLDKYIAKHKLATNLLNLRLAQIESANGEHKLALDRLNNMIANNDAEKQLQYINKINVLQASEDYAGAVAIFTEAWQQGIELPPVLQLQHDFLKSK